MAMLLDRSTRSNGFRRRVEVAPSVGSVVLTLTVFLAAASETEVGVRNSSEQRKSVRDHWELYKARYNKTFSNQSEENQRRNLRQMRLEKIHAHNRIAMDGKYSYVLRENHLVDLTPEEYHKLLGYRKLPRGRSSLVEGRRSPRSAGARSSAPIYRATVNEDRLPTCVNWTAHGWVGPVRRQGKCGSCWSYSSVGALQSQYYNVTGKSVQLSEQNLLDCTLLFGNLGCDGGNMQNAFRYVQNNGIETLQMYPSVSSLTGVSASTCQFNPRLSIMNISHWQNVDVNSEFALQEAVASIGPVSAALDTSSEEFQTYGGGVYRSSTCGNTENDINHAILVVGYGVYEGQPYWLIQNTWGPEWGINGYMMLARNADNMCGIATDATFPVIGLPSNFSSMGKLKFLSDSRCPSVGDAFPLSSTATLRSAVLLSPPSFVNLILVISFVYV